MVRHTQTRERLVRTAGELFWTQGYAQTGVSSIMKHARATSGSFYHFFPTKDDLLLAVLDAVGDYLESEILQPAEEASDDSLRRVMALADAYLASVARNSTTFGIPVGALTCELGTGHEPALRRLDEIYGWFTARVAEWFMGEQESRWGGLIGQDLAGFVIASLEGSVSMAKASRDPGNIDACGQQLGLYMEAVSGSGPRQAEGMPVPSPLGNEAGDWKAW